MKTILVIGSSARLDCILDALHNSPQDKQIFTISPTTNISISNKSIEVKILKDLLDFDAILEYAKKVNPDFVIIGPELPLVYGIVNILEDNGYPCVGPNKETAKLEGSKSFCRYVSWNSNKFDINPKYIQIEKKNAYHRVTEIAEIAQKNIRNIIKRYGEYVLKPNGLTGGKGVQVKGEHFHTDEEAFDISMEIIKNDGSVLIEEKFEGEEFSFISITDGYTLKHTFPVQDHKRAYENDTGSNCGGMGSYSMENHSLPFLNYEDIMCVKTINSKMVQGLHSMVGSRFKGFLYGGFIKTTDGIKLIEYNVRFGDPEVMNILPLLKTDFIDLCEAIVNKNLKNIEISFKKKATVCKYIVPSEYPKPNSGGIIPYVPESTKNVKLYYGNVSNTEHGIKMHGSRAIAVVGIDKTIEKAERRAQDVCKSIKGPIRFRNDIGTKEQLLKRTMHMEELSKFDKKE